MTEIECGYCWRLANLSPEQRADPANAITGTVRMCPAHQRLHDQVAEALAAAREPR